MSRAKRTTDTRRLYKFEKEWFRGEADVSMKTLQDLAKAIWKEELPWNSNKPIPKVVAGKGTKYNGRYYSYYDGERIVIARSERKKFVLVHEMVHALGHDDHDEDFVEQYFDLLHNYKVCDRRALRTIGISYGICEEPNADIW